MVKVLVVGGGYAGFYTAWGLERRLKRGEAEVTVVDPRPYMTYQPFLPEVAAGSVEARSRGGLPAQPPAPDQDHRRFGDRRSTTPRGRRTCAPPTTS